MIRISKIDNDLSVYKGKKVVVCGGAGKGNNGILMQDKLLQLDIPIYALCDDIPSIWGQYYNDTPIISPGALMRLAEEHDDVVVQIASGHEDEEKIVDWLKTTKVSDYIYCDEAFNMLNLLKHVEIFKIDKSFRQELLQSFAESAFTGRRTRMWSYFVGYNNHLLLLLPPKTGDHTLDSTFSKANTLYYNMYHIIGIFNRNLTKLNNNSKIKFVTAVRDPIAQNLSMTYQFIGGLTSLLLMYDDTKLANFLKDGGDAQDVFDIAIFDLMKYMEDMEPIGQIPTERMTSQEIYEYLMQRIYYIQRFIPEFQKQILDIMKEPFDKEKGYSIIEDDNIEVFVYQLEKMNDIAPALSKFANVEIEEIIPTHAGGDKWSGESYKQAQKDIRFSQEYFDKCYNEPYVKHFYSDEDIEKFKNKWKNNIK